MGTGEGTSPNPDFIEDSRLIQEDPMTGTERVGAPNPYRWVLS